MHGLGCASPQCEVATADERHARRAVDDVAHVQVRVAGQGTRDEPLVAETRPLLTQPFTGAHLRHEVASDLAEPVVARVLQPIVANLFDQMYHQRPETRPGLLAAAAARRLELPVQGMESDRSLLTVDPHHGRETAGDQAEPTGIGVRVDHALQLLDEASHPGGAFRLLGPHPRPDPSAHCGDEDPCEQDVQQRLHAPVIDSSPTSLERSARFDPGIGEKRPGSRQTTLYPRPMRPAAQQSLDNGIYLDHAATTPPAGAVLDAMEDAASAAFGNPSSQHAFGEHAKRLLADAREFLRGTLCGARVVLTGGGTEADVLGVTGAALARRPGRVLVGAADHAAVLAQSALLSSLGHRLETIPVNADGGIDAETFYGVLGKDVRVVSLLHGHNELGTLLDLRELVEIVRRIAPEAHIHVDLVQSYGKVDFDLDLAGVDSAAVSGHKLHGPRGVGLLALSSKAKIVPLQAGGGQEEGLRGGTENLAGAVGLATAAELAFSRLRENAEHMEELATRFLRTVADEYPKVERLGDPQARLPHVLSLRIPGVVGASLQQRLAARGIAISTAAHATKATTTRTTTCSPRSDCRNARRVRWCA